MPGDSTVKLKPTASPQKEPTLTSGTSYGPESPSALGSSTRERECEEVRRRRRERCLELRGGAQADGSFQLDDHCLTEWSSNEEWAAEGAEYVMPPTPLDAPP